METLRGAGLYVMTKGGPFELLICGRGFRISGMVRTRQDRAPDPVNFLFKRVATVSS